MVDGVRTFDPVGAFQRGRRGQQVIAAEAAAAPRRNQLADLQLEQARVGAQRQATTFDQKQALQRATIIGQSVSALRGLPLEQRDAAFAAISPQLQTFGIDPALFANIPLIDQNLDSAIAQTQAFRSQQAAQPKFVGSPVRVERDGQTFLSGIVQNPDGSFGRQDVPLEGELVSTIGETPTQQQTRAIETEVGKAAGKAGVKLKTEPAIQAAVLEAVSEVKAFERIAGEERSNSKVLDAYNTAMKGLVDALSGTDTGPFVGLLPALTSNQQIADGAVAAMAPILKGIFRTAGEGTFTDQDQEILTKMIPTRTDTPASRRSKIQNIDAIIRAKLGQTAQQPTTAPAPSPAVQPQAAPVQQTPTAPPSGRQGGSLMTDAQGNRAFVFPDGTFEEVQ